MERHEILEAMSELKLYGMRASFDEIAGKGLARRDEIYPLIASLIRAERTHRQARSISYRIGGAKFPVLKDLDKFVFADTSVDEGQVRELAAGIASGDVILTVLARQREPVPPPSITTPDALRLKHEPTADCGRYDSIRRVA